MITKFVKSVGYALKGIWTGIKEERNVRIDIVAAFYVLLFSKFYDFTFTQKQVLLSFVPRFVARKYITNKKYRKQVFKLWKKETFTDPLMCKKDLSFKRIVWLFLRKINYIKKYNKNNW